MNLPEPLPKQFSSLMDDVSSGRLKIPQFQREFVWEIKKSASLLDSVVKGYPVGSFIFWKTRERLRAVKNIGNLNLPEPAKGDYVNFVLDGQQRITSLFAALKGEKIVRDTGKEENFAEIYIDLEAKEDEKIVTHEVEDKQKEQLIKLTDLLYGGLTSLAQYPAKYHHKLEEYKKRIESYNYSVIQVGDVPIDVASEIFTRVNEGGKPLSPFEIMVAKTYDYEKNFDLAEKFDQLVETLKNVNYETISNATVLQIAALILTKECKRKIILNLDKEKFIELWDKVTDAVERAVDYFRDYYRIPVSQLLPYNALVVPFAYFFYHHNDKPTGDKQKYLQDFFWRVALAGRYSSAVESKLAQDIKKIDKILHNELPKYDWPINTSPEFIKDNGWFNAGSSYIKAILCIYAYHQPKSFIDDSLVNISNYWLKQANSKNYHHFFPKAYLTKLNEEERKINHILNITIVDDFLNKRKIRDNPPSEYMAKFKRDNPHLAETMKTHLITDLDKFGVWANNYHSFFEKRGEVVSKEIEKRIIKQTIDEKPQADLTDEISEESEVE
ncbi:MAG: hypothetical protein COU70_01200 [Parcubacteria group bacterium CG10_big_fil_rev_8_21_14_0_10_35_15]|nr:MAG: hypothetical protein COU70_01200 [Parcubacteria group bacterium CG10_big_fil_rev_8_21_14_0_10_35_15]